MQAATDVSFGYDAREEEPEIKVSADLLRQLIDEFRQLKLDVA